MPFVAYTIEKKVVFVSGGERWWKIDLLWDSWTQIRIVRHRTAFQFQLWLKAAHLHTYIGGIRREYYTMAYLQRTVTQINSSVWPKRLTTKACGREVILLHNNTITRTVWWPDKRQRNSRISLVQCCVLSLLKLEVEVLRPKTMSQTRTMCLALYVSC